MPARAPVTDPACIEVQFSQADDASIHAGCRFFLSYTGSAPSIADLNTLATAVSVAWTDNLAPLVTADESLQSVTITDLSSDTGAVGVWAGDIAGSRSGAGPPASICAVINHKIARRYRGGRPRTFVRMGTESDIPNTNEWSEAFQTAGREGWEAFIAQVIATTGIGISSLAIVNISFFKSFTPVLNPITGRTKDVPTPRDTPLVDPITLSTMALKLGSQRRRLNL